MLSLPVAFFLSKKKLTDKLGSQWSKEELERFYGKDWKKDRDGFVMGEGAGVLLLEELEHAKYPVTPLGLQQEINKFNLLYGNPLVFIYENGQWTASNSTLQDVSRVKYLHGYIGMLDALRNGANIRGYFVWSVLDLFELLDGYKLSFGLHYVDQDDPELKRYPKPLQNGISAAKDDKGPQRLGEAGLALH